jgi:hypothetical protein
MDDAAALDIVSTTASAATKLRRIVGDEHAFLVCPGVYDGFSARIALQVGFDGLYMVRFTGAEGPSPRSRMFAPLQDLMN